MQSENSAYSITWLDVEHSLLGILRKEITNPIQLKDIIIIL